MTAINGQTMLPDLLRAYPQARSVLDRYGLRGCGGEYGPVESLQFFARAHGVEEPQLLREIEATMDRPHIQREVVRPGIADTIYRSYFTAGICTILTLGASWGAYLLWRIGFAGDFTAISIHDINAHGHAQIFGWVGLFIMGFAYQAFPRFWHTSLAWPRLAIVALCVMVAGIVIRTCGMTLSGDWIYAVCAAMLGAVMEIAAVSVFAVQIAVTFIRAEHRVEPYMIFIFTAIGWFLLQACFSAWHTWNTMTAPSHESLLWYIATYQAPLRDIQIHGLAMFMIFGVSIRMLPPLFDLPEVSARRAMVAFGVLLLAVAGESIVIIVYRFTHNHAVAALLLLPWLLLAVGSWLVAGQWKLWRPLPVNDRSGKFIRAAYGWLAVSLVMLLAMPLYQAVTGIAFSHAYYGAIRHAITVGFISMMIMGFAAKVVPTLNGLDVRRLSPLWGPFILINLGCFLRVSTQTLTDVHTAFFAVVGVSGMLEVTALAWWGLGLIGLMRSGRQEQNRLAREARPARIDSAHLVGDVIEWFPQTLNVFDAFGFEALRNPMMRKTVARATSVERAARMKRVSIDALLVELNRVI